MKQVGQNYRSGELVVLDVPEPACRPGGVLVRSLYSLISTGTELMKVTEARLSLLGKARARAQVGAQGQELPPGAVDAREHGDGAFSVTTDRRWADSHGGVERSRLRRGRGLEALEHLARRLRALRLLL